MYVDLCTMRVVEYASMCTYTYVYMCVIYVGLCDYKVDLYMHECVCMHVNIYMCLYIMYCICLYTCYMCVHVCV